ncbi:MAG: Carbohydrate/purine kinase pfkB family protein [candidate division TM6 bacterium GW2011_GWF2_28_16]|nr:MAG: Carbohydrate/purine kinase pfkB family protein [candidate division TM6 bacterium GW2011_GWF2_28_16]
MKKILNNLHVLTIGGATKDIYLSNQGTDYMTINQKDCQLKYMLLKAGDKIEIENILNFTGGGATNSAVSFKRLGFKATCISKIGTDEAGNLIIQELEKENIDTKNIIRTNKISTGTSFIINSLERERTIFAYRGANGFIEKKDINLNNIKNIDQIYITSLSHESSKILPDIVNFAHENNIPVAINPGISQLAKGTQTLKDSLKYIDTIIMNSDEAKSFMIALTENDSNYKESLKSSMLNCTPCETTENKPSLLNSPLKHLDYYFSIWKFFKEILKLGPKTVVITDGANGVYAANNKNIFYHPSIKTNVIDTLGAGDSFGSCFVASILSGHKVEAALVRGIINSSSVISKFGAKPGLLTNDELDKKEINLNLIQKFELN